MLKSVLRTNPVYGLSPLRLWIMRIPYFFTGIFFSFAAWSNVIAHWGTFDPMAGVAQAFWCALSLLAVLGLRFPIKMLPLLLLQFAYKLIWILAVGYPLMERGDLDAGGQELFKANAIGVVIDVVAIPWLYVAKTYIVGIFTANQER